METIDIAGITISVEKKPIKNMYIKVLPPDGRVKITAPNGMDDGIIRDFATSKLHWIRKHRENIVQRHSEEPAKYISGEILWLWGKKYTLEVRFDRSCNSVVVENDKVIMTVPEGFDATMRGEVITEWYRDILKSAIPSVLDRCTAVVGQKPQQWRIRNMKTKWGTCNRGARRIWLNLQLVKKPPECLDYVVIHELVHFLEPYHNDRFKMYMDSFCPDWRRIKKVLNDKI